MEEHVPDEVSTRRPAPPAPAVVVPAVPSDDEPAPVVDLSKRYQVLVPKVPLNSCGMIEPAVVQALNGMQFQVLSNKPLP